MSKGRQNLRGFMVVPLEQKSFADRMLKEVAIIPLIVIKKDKRGPSVKGYKGVRIVALKCLSDAAQTLGVRP